MAFESLTSRLGGVFSSLRQKGKLSEKIAQHFGVRRIAVGQLVE